MSIAPLMEKADAPAEVRAAYEEIERSFGEVLAHKPGSVEPVWRLHRVLMFEGELDPSPRELAVLKIGALDHAGY